MRQETRKEISAEWNRCSIQEQRNLIKEFIEKHGTSRTLSSEWFIFLAEEFGIYDHDFSSTHKTDYYRGVA